MYNKFLSSKIYYILFYIFVPYISPLSVQYRHKTILSLFTYIYFCSAYVIRGLSLPCSWLTGAWKFYKQMCSKTHLTLKSNISENATKNRLFQIASIVVSFIFTSSALAGLFRPAVSETFFFYNFRIFISSTLDVYWIIEVFVLQITALHITSHNIIHVSKDTLTMLRKFSRIVELRFCYQRQSRLPLIFLYLTPCSG